MTTKTRKNTKRVSKGEKRALVCAQGERCFWTTDGRIISNLVELRDMLNSMAQEVFSYHVTREKNDFADWIQYVLEDADLASDFRKAKKPKTARILVVRRLKAYKA
jgi:hypothetical protein